MSVRLRGTARRIDDELKSAIFKCERLTPQEISEGEVSKGIVQQIKDAADNSEEIIRIINDCSSRIDDSIETVDELLFIKERFNEAWQKYSSMFIACAKNAITLELSVLNAIEEDDKRFFKKIDKQNRDIFGSYVSYANHFEQIIRTRMTLLNMIIENLPETIDFIEDKIKERIKKDELDNIAARESAKVNAASNSMLKFYESQIQVLMQAKKEGLVIDSQIAAMRKDILTQEREENSAMLKELLDTLNKL